MWNEAAIIEMHNVWIKSQSTESCVLVLMFVTLYTVAINCECLSDYDWEDNGHIFIYSFLGKCSMEIHN